MENFISVIHILIAIVLIALVLAQDSKSGGMGMLSGGSSSVFGASGASNILVTMTKWTAILFALTCIGLTIMSSNKSKSVIDSVPASVVTEAPIETAEKMDNEVAAPEQEASPEKK